MMATLQEWATRCHAANQTWWHDPATGEKLVRDPFELLMLIVSELSEAMEGERKDLMDDKLPHRKMAEVECADAMIRLFDFAGGLGYALDDDDRIPHYAGSHGKAAQLYFLVSHVTGIGRAISQSGPTWRPPSEVIVWTISGIEWYAKRHEYDLYGAIEEKMAYNAVRADHKPAARLAPNGKQF